jgi:hypothetical protein
MHIHGNSEQKLAETQESLRASRERTDFLLEQVNSPRLTRALESELKHVKAELLRAQREKESFQMSAELLNVLLVLMTELTILVFFRLINVYQACLHHCNIAWTLVYRKKVQVRRKTC